MYLTKAGDCDATINQNDKGMGKRRRSGKSFAN
jgi:hypothetical protein